MVRVRVLIGAPLMAGTAVALIWRSIRAARPPIDWYDEPLPEAEPVGGGSLAFRLLRGEVTGEVYRREMESLAARDAAGHPLVVPSESRR